MADPARRPAAPENLSPVRHIARLGGRSARLAGRLATIATVAATVATATATADSGGLSAGSGGGGGGGGTGITPASTPGCPASPLGSRTLELGDCGDDVTTLNWILKAERYGAPALVDEYESPTEAAVRGVQRDSGLSENGIFDRDASAALVAGMPKQIATWYGPGFFGNATACGQTLTHRTLGVAHKKLPCGSKVVLRYKGRFIRTRVIDRGPFANHAKWDLTAATASALHFEYTDRIRATAIRSR